MKNQKKPSTTFNRLLWIAQFLLAAMFLMAGIMKSTQPIAEIGASLPWVNEVPAALVRFIGISELLGAIGLLLPSILRMKPLFTVLAASGITLIMVLAFIYHISKGEYSACIFNVVLGTIAAFIAWGRSK